MSNYPDDFRGTPHDLPTLEESLPADAAAIYKAQAAYRECVKACVAVFKRHGITWLPRKEFTPGGFACGIEDALNDAFKQSFDNAEEENFSEHVRGEDYDAFFAGMYAMLKGADMRTDATNPATLTTKGEKL